ncbi:hypothetical protein TEQG_01738 [Trichophyton equinum CBS 127.97]|uniref:Uncharacterized protein n=1 Tax=Trichophyton equinum (strain ATCC MYA-4606 / CBS 127.97) TaxID=559882 RepID=F2PLA5_TRIEC|nr:hypothetical protein TEQG_01738 [Trichophyton equinum CBS 127.97]
MKAAYFILPLFAALTSARAVEQAARAEVDCANLLTACLSTVASTGQSNSQCAEYEKECGDQSLRQSAILARDASAPAPAPPTKPSKGVPEFHVFAASIRGAVETHAHGKFDADELAKELYTALTSGNCSLGVALGILLKFCGKGGVGINIEGLFNAIFTIIFKLTGEFNGLLLHGAASVGGIAKIILGILGGVTHAGLNIADFIAKIITMFSHGRFDLATLLNTVINFLNTAGVHPRAIGEVSNELMLLSERTSVAARDEMVHARSLLDIPKLIAEIVTCFKPGQKPDWPRLSGLILQVIKELVVGIGKFFIPGLGAIAGRDEGDGEIVGRGIAVARGVKGGLKIGAGADWPRFAQEVIDLIMHFSIGKLIKVVISFFTNLFRPKKA